MITPYPVDQEMRRHHALQVEQKHGKYGPLPRVPGIDDFPGHVDLERSQNPELHPSPQAAPRGT